MVTDQSTDNEMTEADWQELIEELTPTEADMMDDWVQYTYETYGASSPEYQAARIKV